MVADFDEGWLARPEYLKMLTNALLDPDRDVRRLAVRAMGAIGGHGALEPLSHALEDEEQSVREAAVVALVAVHPQYGARAVLANTVPLVAPLLNRSYMDSK